MCVWRLHAVEGRGHLDVRVEVVDGEEEQLACRLGPHAPQPEGEVELSHNPDLACAREGRGGGKEGGREGERKG